MVRRGGEAARIAREDGHAEIQGQLAIGAVEPGEQPFAEEAGSAGEEKPRAAQRRLQSAPHRFDLGKFRHGPDVGQGAPGRQGAPEAFGFAEGKSNTKDTKVTNGPRADFTRCAIFKIPLPSCPS